DGATIYTSTNNNRRTDNNQGALSDHDSSPDGATNYTSTNDNRRSDNNQGAAHDSSPDGATIYTSTNNNRRTDNNQGALYDHDSSPDGATNYTSTNDNRRSDNNNQGTDHDHDSSSDDTRCHHRDSYHHDTHSDDHHHDTAHNNHDFVPNNQSSRHHDHCTTKDKRPSDNTGHNGSPMGATKVYPTVGDNCIPYVVAAGDSSWAIVNTICGTKNGCQAGQTTASTTLASTNAFCSASIFVGQILAVCC
ncbi:hypothetical protein As57867_011501, partial [Aphanomyces stellatus]